VKGVQQVVDLDHPVTEGPRFSPALQLGPNHCRVACYDVRLAVLVTPLEPGEFVSTRAAQQGLWPPLELLDE